MNEPAVPPTRQLVAELLVGDLERAIAFYVAFGFVLERKTDGFAALTWEGSQLFLDQRPGLAAAPDEPRMNIRVMVRDVDSMWLRAIEIGAPVVQPLSDRFYGLRDFTIADPDGFGLRFASEIAGSAH